MKNQEDLTFLHSMKTDRKATFGALDKMTAAREKRKEARLSAENDRKRMYEEQASTSKGAVSSRGSEYCDDDESLQQPSKQRPHKRVKKTSTSVFIPHDIQKRPKLVSLDTRMKLTPSQQAAFTQGVIEEAGGNS